MIEFALALSTAKDLLEALLECFFASLQLLSESLPCMEGETQRFLVHNSQAYLTGGEERNVKAFSDKVHPEMAWCSAVEEGKWLPESASNRSAGVSLAVCCFKGGTQWCRVLLKRGICSHHAGPLLEACVIQSTVLCNLPGHTLAKRILMQECGLLKIRSLQALTGLFQTVDLQH